MKRYPLKVRDNCLLIDVNGQAAFIDTGSPITVARNGFRMDGQIWPKNPSSIPISEAWRRAPEFVSQQLEERIDALVGMDILRDYYFRAEFGANEFVMSRESITEDGYFYALEGNLDAPIMTVQLRYGDGESMSAHVDTGAKQSFILARHVRRWPKVGTVDDFSPFIGKFTANRHRIPVQIANRDLALDFAVMPEFYETSGVLRGAGAVLGNDLWDYFDVTYAPPDNGIWLKALRSDDG